MKQLYIDIQGGGERKTKQKIEWKNVIDEGEKIGRAHV